MGTKLELPVATKCANLETIHTHGSRILQGASPKLTSHVRSTCPKTGPKKHSPHATGDSRPIMIVANFVNPVLVTLPFFGFKARHCFNDRPAQIGENVAVQRMVVGIHIWPLYCSSARILRGLPLSVLSSTSPEPQTAISFIRSDSQGVVEMEIRRLQISADGAAWQHRVFFET